MFFKYITLTAEEDYTWTHSENGSVWHGGRGKWVDENGETPIWFEETPQGDPLASYGGYAYRGFMIYSEEESSNSPIAMLISDTENPELIYYLGADKSDVSNVWSDPVSVTAEAIKLGGFNYFLEIAGFIGINLAVFNLLPIPPLDGSRIAFAIPRLPSLFSKSIGLTL